MNKLVWWMTLCLAILTPITAVAGPVPGRRTLRDATAELEEQKTAICKTAFARTEVLRARVAEIRDEIAAVHVPPPPKKPTAADNKNPTVAKP